MHKKTSFLGDGGTLENGLKYTGELLWPPPEVADGEDVENPMPLGTLNALF